MGSFLVNPKNIWERKKSPSFKNNKKKKKLEQSEQEQKQISA